MELITERLKIRKASIDDAPFFLELLNQKSYISMIRDSDVRDIESAEKYVLDYYLESYRKNGFGLYIAELLRTGELIGIAGLVKRAELDCPDLGFAILDRFSNNGYIKEACESVIRYGFEHLGISKLVAITTLENLASNAILKKLGFVTRSSLMLGTSVKEFILYEKNRS